MAIKNPRSRRLSSTRLAATLDSHTALGQLPDYQPSRKEYAAETGNKLHAAYTKARAAEIQALNALNKARDAAAASEWSLYDYMQGAAEQVLGQYGGDSDQYAALGYKKKSEYRKSAPGSKAAAKKQP